MLGTLQPAQAQQVLPEPNPQWQGMGSPMSLLRQPDGKVIVGGQFDLSVGVQARNLVRFETDGSLDTSWAPVLDAPVVAMQLASDGWLYVLMRPALAGVGMPVGFAAVRRIDTQGDGTLDADFLPAAPTGAFDVGTLHVDDAGGGLYVSYNVTVSERFDLVRYHLDDGSLDPAFVVQTVQGIASVVRAGEHLILGGWFDDVNVAFRRGLARVDRLSGAVDASWNPEPMTMSIVRALLVDGDHVLVGGSFQNLGGSNRSLARISLTNGTADAAWNTPIQGTVWQLARDDQGRILIGGNLSQIGVQPWPNRLARFGADGAHDTGWSATDLSLADHPLPVIALGDDALTIAQGAGVEASSLRRVDGTSGTTSSFTTATTFPSAPEVLRAFRLANNDLALTTHSTRLGGVVGIGAARMDASGSLAGGWQWALGSEFGTASLTDAAVSSEHLYLTGYLDGALGLQRPAIRLALDDGTLDAGWAPQGVGQGLRLALDEPAGQLYLASQANPAPQPVRYALGDGTIDPGWTPPGIGGALITQIATSGEHLYVAGGFNTPGFPLLRSLLRFALDGSGTPDTTWQPNPRPLEVYAIAVDQQGGWVFAETNTGLRRYRISDGVRDETWAPLANVPAFIERMVFNPADRSLYVIGNMQIGCGGEFLRAARLYSGANRGDPRWRVNVGAFDEIRDALPRGEDSVVLVGRFGSVNGTARSSVAAVGPSESLFADGVGDHASECVR